MEGLDDVDTGEELGMVGLALILVGSRIQWLCFWRWTSLSGVDTMALSKFGSFVSLLPSLYYLCGFVCGFNGLRRELAQKNAFLSFRVGEA